jgi:hypothetical protein
MSTPQRRVSRAIPLAIGGLTVVTLVPLLVWDRSPELFPDGAHEALAAIPLALIAVAYVVHEAMRRAGPRELAKAGLLAAAFLFWAANQFWPDHPLSTLFNDIAIALFVLDVFLAILGRPIEREGGHGSHGL